MDRALIGKFASGTAAVEEIARKELAIGLREFAGGWKRIWGRDIEARRRVLYQLLASAGINDGDNFISTGMSSSFVDDFAGVDKYEVEQLINELAS
jgi:hypothetical protein